MSGIAKRAITSANRQWRKDNNIGPLGTGPAVAKFREWCKNEHGFEYKHYNSGFSVSTTVLDEKKYAWFLLRWS